MDWTSLGQILIVIFGSLFIWFCLSGIIHIIFYVTNAWEKITLKITRPKPKRYLTKVDPIYELKDCQWDTGLSIHKWALKYVPLMWVQFFLLLIPYPIEIMYWRYRHENSMFLCKKEDVVNITEDLAKLYEDKMAPQLKEWDEISQKFKPVQDEWADDPLPSATFNSHLTKNR
jgi:hypothetical protein